MVGSALDSFPNVREIEGLPILCGPPAIGGSVGQGNEQRAAPAAFADGSRAEQVRRLRRVRHPVSLYPPREMLSCRRSLTPSSNAAPATDPASMYAHSTSN
jgi:hypothetical protein